MPLVMMDLNNLQMEYRTRYVKSNQIMLVMEKTLFSKGTG